MARRNRNIKLATLQLMVAKEFPKFIQLAFSPNTGELFALDEDGDIWRRRTDTGPVAWFKQTGRK